jgi:hypothetical protein
MMKCERGKWARYGASAAAGPQQQKIRLLVQALGRYERGANDG